MSKQTGGPAFPVERHVAHALALKNVGSEDEKKYIAEVNKLCGGMTLRDYTAIKAMQGILANSAMADNSTDSSIQWVVNAAYAYADAMLEAREG
ncbi:hypothetical protein [Pectobacterium aroidearum]|uniref:hypothetical protein n=1 Tax=Pectobacterium aroidearum TaxID=1201031 RepID=UPI001CD5E520|nr:hypothetical protein [Pectobacterium aroidearum]